jgi:TolB-like protein/tetratricopeptide (TPR) repeat protein
MSGDSPLSGDATQTSGPLEAAHPALSKDVFVSYASQDAAVANAVVEALEGQGIRCWIAPRDVVPGSLYADEIVGAINDAKVVLLVLSEHSITSPHVGKEIERASSKRRRIIALHLDSAALTRAFEYFLSESQWIDVGAGGTEAALPKLVEAVRRHLDPSTAAESHGQLRQQGGRPVISSSKKWLLAGGVTVLSLALAYFVVDKLWLSKRIATEKPVAQTPAAVVFAPPPHSIAVLPFVNMSGDASQEYFSDGITEELLNSLSRLNELQVVARTSSFSFKGQNVDVSTIAHKLNVGAILEGSVRRSGNTVRITVQLINPVTGFHRWSQTYDWNLTDILKVQTDVATSVARELEIQLVGDETAKLDLGGTSIPAAYDAYLRGVQLYIEADTQEASDRTALAAVDQAIALDPRYPAAHALRAEVLTSIIHNSNNLASRVRMREQAVAAAERAVALAPEFGEAHLALGRVRARVLFDVAGAAPEFDRALALAPGSAKVQRNFAQFAVELGRFDSAVTAARRAASLDSQNFRSYGTLANVLYFARRFGEAEAALKMAEALKPSAHTNGIILILILLASDRVEQARQLCESSATPLDEDDRQAFLALIYFAEGRRVEAQQELEVVQKLDGDSSAYLYARIYAKAGDKTAALQWLAKAEELHDPDLHLLKVDLLLDPIRNEPQFKAIEARMNFPP